MVRVRHERVLRALRTNERPESIVSALMLSVVYPQAFLGIVMMLIGGLAKRAAIAEGVLLFAAALFAPTRQSLYAKVTGGLTFLFFLHLCVRALGRARAHPYSDELACARLIAVLTNVRALWIVIKQARRPRAHKRDA